MDELNPTQEEIQRVNALWEARQQKKSSVAPEPTPEQLALMAEHWTKVFSDPPKKVEISVSRNIRQEMNYEDAKIRVWRILQQRAEHIQRLENKPFEWSFSQEEILIMRNAIRFFINDPECEWSLTKGLFVYGSPGTGKTEIIRALSKFTREHELTKSFVHCSLSEIHVLAKSDKEYDPIFPNLQQDRCFDEFGRYTGPITRFGDLLDINEAIIEQRYERHRRYGQLTHFIANATPQELEQVFSPMIFDRLKSMCTGVHFPGTSKRQ